jgi:hypothetical protein
MFTETIPRAWPRRDFRVSILQKLREVVMTLTFKDVRLSDKDSSSALVREAQSSRVGEESRAAAKRTFGPWERPAMTLKPGDIGLLLRRMAVLSIDPDELDSADPLLFRELQGRCALCRSKGRCARDLGHDAADLAWQGWKEYCPNGATLGKLAQCRAASFSRMASAWCGT